MWIFNRKYWEDKYFSVYLEFNFESLFVNFIKKKKNRYYVILLKVSKVFLKFFHLIFINNILYYNN